MFKYETCCHRFLYLFPSFYAVFKRDLLKDLSLVLPAKSLDEGTELVLATLFLLHSQTLTFQHVAKGPLDIQKAYTLNPY